MAEIKDKVVTAESLKTLHEYNQKTFETKENAEALYETKENAEALYETKENVESLLNTKFDKPENDIVPIVKGGTNASDGATALANLLADGALVLSSHQHGTELPKAGIAGRIFFKELVE